MAAATTSTFSLRKLIQTKLHQEDDDAFQEEDSASFFNDDQKNPIKRRLTTWLPPPARRSSTSGGTAPVSAHGRSNSDLQRAPSPLPSANGSSHQRKPSEASNAFSNAGAPSNSNLSSASALDSALAKLDAAKRQDPDKRTLNDAPPSTTSHARSRSEASAKPGSLNCHVNYFVLPQTNVSSAVPVAVPDKKQNKAQPTTFLASPTHSSVFDSSSSHRGSADNSAVPTRNNDNNLDTKVASTPDTTLPTVSLDQPSTEGKRDMETQLLKDWSDGVRELIRETDQAFDSVGNDLVGAGLDINPLVKSQDLSSRSDPDLSLAPRPLALMNSNKGDHIKCGPKAEAPLEITPRRGSRRDSVLMAERRKSRSVPPPIQVRKSSPPPPGQTSARQQGSSAPRSAREPTKTPKTADSTKSSSHGHLLKPSLSIRKPLAQHSQSHANVNAPQRRPSKATRWALPENVTELLTGSVFKRHEIEEILTEEQLERVNKERAEAQRKASLRPTVPPKDTQMNYSGRKPPKPKPISKDDAEEPAKETLSKNPEEESKPAIPPRADRRSQGHQKNASEGSIAKSINGQPDSPANPFFTSEPALATVDDKATSTHEEDKPPIPAKNMESRRRRWTNIVETEPELSSAEEADDEEDENDGLATFDFLGSPSPMTQMSEFPMPPPKHPKRNTPPPCAELPNIPPGKKRKNITPTLKAEEDDEFYYLKSTPYTLTVSSFRHGPIAFAKSDLGRGAKTMDETLDWTAFQMAILGAGEILPDLYDEGDARYADDLRDWFADFGFETHGQLVPGACPPSPPSSSRSSISSVEGDLPEADYDTTKFFRGKGLKRWTMEGKPKDGSVSTGATHKRNDSSSPVTLVVDEDDKVAAKQHEEEAVKKGGLSYNLQHDLGDFLKWEAQHMGGFYGAH
ncbi:uncharacterized protein J7T54_003700 [Emericellopsis cladophorae]|uniref:Uncharacterized protein n=1 Tax=Emericellopsis cladophorae TaxID=2686198 RepID=A0A9P9XYB9_9HYPO|nr:uncharacterized protein J7T54_003700 [Emericellopsis cladophorae]KAI6779778.1 hypothetical protein J7T54_003700 [Emericellopsis cladophorae]